MLRSRAPARRCCCCTKTPRSWDEFREVLPILGRHYRAIAMDTVGYGDFRSVTTRSSLNRKLGESRACAPRGARHYARGPSSAITPVPLLRWKSPLLTRRQSLRLCCRPVPTLTRRGARRRKRSTKLLSMKQHRGWTVATLRSSGRCGSHFIQPTASIFLERFMMDALKAGPRAAEGHRVVDRYEMERRLPLPSAARHWSSPRPRTRMPIRTRAKWQAP